MSKLKIIDETTIKATEEYLSRKIRKSHPDGTFDKANRWYPSDLEVCECCSTVRAPSRAYPYSIMTHCRSIAHIANKYEVDAKAIRMLSRLVLLHEKDNKTLSVLDAAAIAIDNNSTYIPETGLFD